MRDNRWAVLAGLLCVVAVAAHAPRPVAPVITSHHRPRHGSYCDDHACAAIPQPSDLRYHPPHGRCRIAFVGDSITYRWQTVGAASWRRFEAMGAKNYGVPGDTTGNLVWRLQCGQLRQAHPSLVVLMIGTNDIGFGVLPVNLIANERRVIDLIQHDCPRARILLLGIPEWHRASRCAYIDPRIREYNQRQARQGCEFMPLPRLLTDQFSDGVHPTASAYAAIAKTLSTYLRLEPECDR